MRETSTVLYEGGEQVYTWWYQMLDAIDFCLSVCLMCATLTVLLPVLYVPR